MFVGAAIVVVAIVLVLQHRDSGRVRLAGFDETAVRSSSADPLAWCMLLASTQAQHARGLMQVTDPTLGGYDGMVFRFERRHRTRTFTCATRRCRYPSRSSLGDGTVV